MIYVGSQYFRAPTPKEQDWERDIKQAKEYGLDYFRFWLMWTWYCREENKYDFSSLHRLLDLSAKYGMKVIMLLNLESVPPWLVKKHPEAIYVDSAGGLYAPESVGNTPGGGFPGLCFHNRPIVEYGRDYIKNVVSTFKDHPAIECWEPHNEPMYEPSRYSNDIYCYCNESIRKFRSFLESKYGNIDALNAMWRRNYGNFSEVQPPRRRGIYNNWMDWSKFNLDSLIETLKWRINTIRRNDPNHYVMIHSRGGGGLMRDLVKEGIDDYRMAPLVDKYGTAAFPQWAPEDEYFLAMTSARCAAGEKEFWMAELQAGPYGMGVHRNDAHPACDICGASTIEEDLGGGTFDAGVVTPERLKMWSWSGIALGGKGVMYWQYRCESFGVEYGFGLTDLDGSVHNRLRVVKEFHEVIRKNEALIDNANMPACEIALALEPRNDIVNYVAIGCTCAVKNSLSGIYKVLWHGDYPVDVVCLDKFLDKDDFINYKVIYLPYSPFISKAVADKLKNYVKRGGTLVAEGSTGQYDDTMGAATMVPGNGLDELFGCRRVDIRTASSQIIGRLSVGGFSIGTRMHKEILSPYDGAEVIGRFESGESAIVENKYGDGRAIYIGSNPFMAYYKQTDTELLKWVNQINKDVRRPAYTDVLDVLSRVLVNGATKLVFLMNTVDKPTTVNIAVSFDSKQKCKVRELLDGDAVKSDISEDKFVIKQKLGPYGTKVYYCES